MANFDDLFAVQSADQSHRSYTPFDKEAWAAQKQKERESVYALIDETAVEMGGNGELFQAYLDVQARFDRYSVGNAILITAQMPEATRLADFDGWKEAGTYVRKGASGITILEPGKEYERENGTIGVSYNVKKVFDVSQTNSRQPVTPVVSRDERLLLKALISNAPCQLSISNELPENINVIYRPEENTILLRQGMDAPTIFRGLSQELARAHIDKGGYSCANPAFSTYCVSYMLCKRSGVAVDTFRFDRMPEAYREMDEQAVRGELGAIREVAGEISTDMNRVFDAQRVVANSASLASAQAQKLTRSVAPPSPAEPASLGFSRDPNRDDGAR